LAKNQPDTVPQRHEHLARARGNEELAKTLDRSKGLCVDWAITMLFYAAVHYIDAYLAFSGSRPKNHQQRDNAVEHNGSLAPIWNDYRRLKDLSEEARYQIASYHEGKLKIADEHLNNIKKHLQAKGMREEIVL